MTKQDWELDKVKPEEIAKHIIDFHKVPFSDRNALTYEEFIEEHFPKTIKSMEQKRNGFLSEDGKKILRQARGKIREAIKFCEEIGEPIAVVYDYNLNNEVEIRICEPSLAHIQYNKWKRHFKIIEGVFHKVLLQDNFHNKYSLKEEEKDVIKALLDGHKDRVAKAKKKAIKVAQKVRKGVKETDEDEDEEKVIF